MKDYKFGMKISISEMLLNVVFLFSNLNISAALAAVSLLAPLLKLIFANPLVLR